MHEDIIEIKSAAGKQVELQRDVGLRQMSVESSREIAGVSAERSTENPEDSNEKIQITYGMRKGKSPRGYIDIVVEDQTVYATTFRNKGKDQVRYLCIDFEGMSISCENIAWPKKALRFERALGIIDSKATKLDIETTAKYVA